MDSYSNAKTTTKVPVPFVVVLVVVIWRLA